MSQVNTAKPIKTKLLGHQHIVGVEIRGHPLLQFGIQGHEQRDLVVRRILSAKEKSLERSDSLGFPGLQRQQSIIKSGGIAIARDASVDVPLDSLTLADATPLVASPAPLELVSSPTSPGSREKEPDWMSSINTTVSSIGDSSKTLFSNRQKTSPEPCPCTAEKDGDEHDPECDSNKITSLLAPISHTIDFVRTHEFPTEAFANLPRPINVPRGVLRGMKSRHFVCLTIGSRGDVQ